MLEVCSRISLSGQRRHRSCVEGGLVLAVIGRCAEEEFRRVKFNFSFDNFEGQDEVSSEASAFQREEVELAKPFLVWLLVEELVFVRLLITRRSSHAIY